MAYQFETAATGTTTTRMMGTIKTHKMTGINATESDANVIVGGLSTMYDIVGYRMAPIYPDQVTVMRTVNQNVTDDGN